MDIGTICDPFYIGSVRTKLAGQFCILRWFSLSLYIVEVTTSGHSKKSIHDRYRVLVPVTIDDSILFLQPRILSVDCRKSRNNLFSIF